MKVSKEMLHPSLQGSYRTMSIMAWALKRRWYRYLFDKLGRTVAQGKDIEGLDCDERYVKSSHDDYEIRTRIYRPKGDNKTLPALVYFHSGGYIFGCPESTPTVIEQYIAARPCVVIAPDYRKSGTKPFPAGFNDCYDTLLWAKDNAEELGVRPDRLMIAGHSAGGGLTAAVALKVRDTQDVDLAFQMPIYPMIDDQQPHDPDRYMETPLWDTELNEIGWSAYLADLHREGAEIPAYAAPARNKDYQGFPPTITFVCDMEPFYQETLDYVQGLRNAEVEVAFQEFKGCFHGFDFLGKGIGDDAIRFTFDQFGDFYDRYVLRHEIAS